jgi:sugar phosphate isomerase/epimerase
MKVGAFSDAIHADTPEDVALRSRAAGMEVVQLRMEWPGLDLLGSAGDRARIRRAYAGAGMEIAALAGYSNILHPEPARRQAALERLERLICLAPELGADLVVTEAGTFDAVDAWASHPHNQTADAWRQLVEVTAWLVTRCEREGVRLAYEPYVATVLSGAHAAHRLSAEIGSPALCFVFDGAGLVTPETLPDNRKITAEACQILAGQIALAHADDVRYEAGRARWLPLGWGDLDAPAVFSGLAGAGFAGALIVEHVSEDLLPAAIAFCKEHGAG